MDKYLTFAGTQPVYLGDVNFMQKAVADTFMRLVRALMNNLSDTPRAILQGVNITQNGDTVTFSPGVVVLDGEILPFEGTTITSAPNYFMHVVSTLSGERTFKDGETHACFDTRKAVINTNSAGGHPFEAIPRLHGLDDANYVMSDHGGFVSSSSLIVRNGICYLEFSYTSTPGEGTTGTARFVVDNNLAVLLFNCPSLVAHAVSNFSGEQYIQPFIININVLQNVVEFQISCEWASANAGSGACRIAIPIFD